MLPNSRLQTSKERYLRALDLVVEDIKQDKQILAAILCGSLAYDIVWDKSDIDLVLVCTDDRKIKPHSFALVADDVNIHAEIQPRSNFKQILDSAVKNSFEHSYLARGRVLFSKDSSLETAFEQNKTLGAHDLAIQVMQAAQFTLCSYYKTQKWFETKDDDCYTAKWVLDAASSMADLEMSLNGQLVDRESLIRATQSNPKTFRPIYTDLLEGKVSRKQLGIALETIDNYLVMHVDELFPLVFDYLRAAGGEPRSVTEIEHYFERNYGVRGIAIACEWLADIGRIEKASVLSKLTAASLVQVEELAFFFNQ